MRHINKGAHIPLQRGTCSSVETFTFAEITALLSPWHAAVASTAPQAFGFYRSIKLLGPSDVSSDDPVPPAPWPKRVHRHRMQWIAASDSPKSEENRPAPGIFEHGVNPQKQQILQTKGIGFLQ